MQKLKLLAALVLTGFLIGCQREPPATPKPAPVSESDGKPFSVEVNDGIEHEFYRNVSLDTLLKQLPSGSVDSLDMNLDGGPQVFALVKVPEQAGTDLTKVRFETTFRIQDGRAIDKRWTAAKGRKAGKVTALFCLPPTVVGGETRIVQNGG
jgi:hypothetical protein